MKAIMISIKPQHVANILNGLKTIEIRKKFPKDYVGWVYIYCTKDTKDLLVRYIDYDHSTMSYYGCWINRIVPNNEQNRNEESKYCHCLNGKVVARFWCDRVETIKEDKRCGLLWSQTMIEATLLKASCLTQKEMYDYLKDKKGYAIRIVNVEIFDKPKDISEFVPYNIKQDHYKPFPTCDFRLTRAPQSFCFIEV